MEAETVEPPLIEKEKTLELVEEEDEEEEEQQQQQQQQKEANKVQEQKERSFEPSDNPVTQEIPPELRIERSGSFFETQLDIAKEIEERNKREFDIYGKEIYISCCRQKNVIPMRSAVEQLSTEHIDLSHRVIDSKDLWPLCLSLNSNATICSLRLDDNSIGMDGAKWLLTALKENVAVREISLAENNLGNGVCNLVAELLAINRNIVSVNLAGNALDDRAGSDIGAILEITYTLKSLNIARNKLSDGAAEEIANSLRYNDSIEDFNIEWNCFLPSGCRLIFNGLRKNLGVRNLAFSHNGTDDTCANNIAEMLQVNHVMTILDLSSSRLTSDGVAAIIGSGLAKNDALEQLNLNNNLLSESVVFDFLDFFQSPNCQPFKKLNLETVPIRGKTADLLNAYLDENPEGAQMVSGPIISGVVGAGMMQTLGSKKDLPNLSVVRIEEPVTIVAERPQASSQAAPTSQSPPRQSSQLVF